MLTMQVLEFRVFNIRDRTQPIRGRLPLTPGSCLAWFGFSEEGQLSCFDSKVGILDMFCAFLVLSTAASTVD